MDSITATKAEIEAAFTEWERRYREEPERFQAEAERLEQNPEVYGVAACATLRFYIEETRS